MRKTLGFALLAAALAASPCRGLAAPSTGTYDYGMQQRKDGDSAGAKKTFMGLLLQNPAGAGAPEGLGLACIGLGQYDEAAVYLGQWNSVAPHNPYVLGLLLRAQGGAGQERAALATAKELAALDPRDCAMRRRVESLSVRGAAAVFPRASAYRSHSYEGLNTASPQHIIYEGSSAGAGFNVPLENGLDLFGGADLARDAQRNGGRGFTYFDLQELSYSAGLAGRYGRGLRWEAEYGQSEYSDISTNGGAPLAAGSLRARVTSGSSMLEAASRPRVLRVSGGGRLYRVARENLLRGETAGPLLGWDWTARGGLGATAGGTALGSLWLRGLHDYGPYTVSGSYSHGQQEFYSAAASGRLRYVQTDRFTAGARRGVKDVYGAGASVSEAFYADSNRLLEGDADLTAWLPGHTDFYGGYRFSYLDYLKVRGGYDTLDEAGHWLVAGWRHCPGYNWSADASYEHGFVSDSISSYGADVYTAGAEWYSGRGSLRLQGRRRATGGRGHSWSAGLQARYSF